MNAAFADRSDPEVLSGYGAPKLDRPDWRRALTQHSKTARTDYSMPIGRLAKLYVAIGTVFAHFIG